MGHHRIHMAFLVLLSLIVNISFGPKTTLWKDIPSAIERFEELLVDSNNNTVNAAQTHSHWLETIRLGKYLGRGVATVTFEVAQLPPEALLPDGANASKPFVIKFMGDHDQFGKPTPKFSEHSAHANEVSSRLAPHPSIPQTILFESSVSNPFRGGIFPLPDKNRLQEQLLRCDNFSISVTERAIATHDHLNRKDALRLPTRRLEKCFWRRLFEILDYAHSRNITWIDTKLWNVLLQDGEIIVFDWHMGEFVVDDGNLTTANASSQQKKLPFGHTTLDVGEKVHDHDVYKLGKRVLEYVRSIPAADWEKVENGGTMEKQLLDLGSRMQKDHPPTLRWLLDNHDYFQDVKRSENCSLTW